jgi:hypothetical protein
VIIAPKKPGDLYLEKLCIKKKKKEKKRKRRGSHVSLVKTNRIAKTIVKDQSNRTVSL